MMGSRSSRSGTLGRRLEDQCGLGRPAVDVSLDVCELVDGVSTSASTSTTTS
jgi:hypothetical protein